VKHDTETKWAERLAMFVACGLAAAIGQVSGYRRGHDTGYTDGYMHGVADTTQSLPVMLQLPDGTTITGAAKPQE
jgi:ABC-type dipeptide/oligopeptide/nickel transport system permease subunit